MPKPISAGRVGEWLKAAEHTVDAQGSRRVFIDADSPPDSFKALKRRASLANWTQKNEDDLEC